MTYNNNIDEAQADVERASEAILSHLECIQDLDDAITERLSALGPGFWTAITLASASNYADTTPDDPLKVNADPLEMLRFMDWVGKSDAYYRETVYFVLGIGYKLAMADQRIPEQERLL